MDPAAHLISTAGITPRRHLRISSAILLSPGLCHAGFGLLSGQPPVIAAWHAKLRASRALAIATLLALHFPDQALGQRHRGFRALRILESEGDVHQQDGITTAGGKIILRYARRSLADTTNPGIDVLQLVEIIRECIAYQRDVSLIKRSPTGSRVLGGDGEVLRRPQDEFGIIAPVLLGYLQGDEHQRGPRVGEHSGRGSARELLVESGGQAELPRGPPALACGAGPVHRARRA
jgi:hypothetical protein